MKEKEAKKQQEDYEKAERESKKKEEQNKSERDAYAEACPPAKKITS